MQNRPSWEGESPSELEDVCRCKMAVRSFIEASWSTYAEQISLPSNRTAAPDSSLQTVYDLAAKRRVELEHRPGSVVPDFAQVALSPAQGPLWLVQVPLGSLLDLAWQWVVPVSPPVCRPPGTSEVVSATHRIHDFLVFDA
jgi:hypothetical protein